jgi:GDP-4-dehydro-6-deoxy-D-mannose reductase
MISEILGIQVDIREERSLIRPIDNPRIIGSNEKIRHELDWYPEIRFEQTLQSMITSWKNYLSRPMFK